MLLQNKHAAIFAATGAIAQGVAREMAKQGAIVHLSGHRMQELEGFASSLSKEGYHATASEVDATDQEVVRKFTEKIVRKNGKLDIVFNGIGGSPKSLGYPAKSDETSLQDFLLPLNKIVGSQFLTSREAARVMKSQKSGSILTLSATLSGGAFRYMAGIAAACGAIEVMTNALADEFGQYGVRVNCVRGSAMPETRTIQETGAGQAALRAGESADFGAPPLGRPISVEETAKAAVFLASDLASGMTAQMVTVCAGQFPTHI